MPHSAIYSATWKLSRVSHPLTPPPIPGSGIWLAIEWYRLICFIDLEPFSRATLSSISFSDSTVTHWFTTPPLPPSPPPMIFLIAAVNALLQSTAYLWFSVDTSAVDTHIGIQMIDCDRALVPSLAVTIDWSFRRRRRRQRGRASSSGANVVWRRPGRPIVRIGFVRKRERERDWEERAIIRNQTRRASEIATFGTAVFVDFVLFFFRPGHFVPLRPTTAALHSPPAQVSTCPVWCGHQFKVRGRCDRWNERLASRPPLLTWPSVYLIRFYSQPPPPCFQLLQS